MREPIAIIEYDTSAAEKEIAEAWQKCQKSEKDNLEFGRVCCSWRDKFGSRGSRKGQGLAQILSKLGIKEGRAYYWMKEYESPLEEEPWNPSDERRKNRDDPVDDFEELRTLAIDMLALGYKGMKNDKPSSHLSTAWDWAKLKLKE